MTRLKQQYKSDGFFGIGILNSAEEVNIGTLWRSAYILGAAFIFTIARKYKKQTSDVTHTWTKIPLFHYTDFNDFRNKLPHSTRLVGVELTPDATPIADFSHPERAVYLLGSENSGLPASILSQCHSVVSLPGNFSLNVAVAGSLVTYDRVEKIGGRLPERIDGSEE